MNRFLKTFLIWMLAAMLPAQVIASSVRMTCGPGSHLPLQDAPALSHSHHGAGADHALHLHAVGVAEEGMSGTDSGDMSGKFKSSHCSACAACCIGAAMTPAALDWTPSGGSAIAPVPRSDSSFDGFIPPGPERPPRLISI